MDEAHYSTLRGRMLAAVAIHATLASEEIGRLGIEWDGLSYPTAFQQDIDH